MESSGLATNASKAVEHPFNKVSGDWCVYPRPLPHLDNTARNMPSLAFEIRHNRWLSINSVIRGRDTTLSPF